MLRCSKWKGSQHERKLNFPYSNVIPIRKSDSFGVYVGEDRDAYHVIGGNQGDRVSIARKPKSRLLGARECPWRVNKPGNVRRVFLAASGALTGGEA